jgi:hypothetical protein
MWWWWWWWWRSVGRKEKNLYACESRDNCQYAGTVEKRGNE